MSPKQRRALEWLLFAVLVAWFVRSALFPAWKSLHTDFPNYFLAASLYRKGFPFERVYDWVWFERQKDHAGLDAGIVSFVPLTPFSALVLVPLTGLAPLVAKHVWLVQNLGFLGVVVCLLRALSSLSWLRAALIVFLTVVPLETSFVFGQQHLLVLLLMALAAWAYVAGKDAMTGALLAVAAALKIYPALFGLFFLAKRRWNAAIALALSGLSLLALSVPLFGREAMRVYLTQVVPRSLAGEGNDPYYAGFNTPTVLLRRLFVREADLNPHPLFSAPLGFCLLSPLVATLLLGSFFWLTVGDGGERRQRLEWGAFVALLLVLSTSSSTYHFCVLILATALVVDALVMAGHPKVALLLVGLHAVVSAPLYGHVPHDPSGFVVFLAVPRLYALLAYFAVVLWALRHVDPVRPRSRRADLAIGASLLVFYLVNVRATLRHWEGQGGGEPLRLDQATLVATAPAAGPSGVFFSRMRDDEYVLGSTSGVETSGERGFDLFHPTLSLRAANEGWVEVSSRHSSVARFDPTAPFLDVREMPELASDGESPVVSHDGHLLLFLRERGDGRTTLWLLPLDRDRSASVARLTDDTYDVLEATFSPSRRVAFSARRDGDTSLFLLDLEPRSLARLRVAAKSPRYPAFSPDGRSLAYASLVGGAFQLHVEDLASGAVQQLTHADCNSTAPAWSPDSATIYYASDCGRNLGNTSIRRLAVRTSAAR